MAASVAFRALVPVPQAPETRVVLLQPPVTHDATSVGGQWRLACRWLRCRALVDGRQCRVCDPCVWRARAGW